MPKIHYTATAKDSRTLELPEEAQALGLEPGDHVHVFVNREGTERTETVKDEERQERLRALTAQLFAETDSQERQSGVLTDSQEERVAAMIAEKHSTIEQDV